MSVWFCFGVGFAAGGEGEGGRERCTVTAKQLSLLLLLLLLSQILGGWTVLAILCASMSTATGAILATSTVMAHNIFRKVRRELRGIRGGFRG